MRRVWDSTPPSLLALGVFALTWCVSAVMLVVAGRHQQATGAFRSDEPWSYYVYRALPDSPGFFELVTNWDGQWHERIATLGYLSSSTDAEGFAQRAWAFPPVYPMTVRAVMEVTSLGFGVSAWLVSTAFAAAAMVLLHRLTRERLGDAGAIALVGVTGCYVTAPIFQVAYAESMAFFFLLWTLLDLQHRRYLRAFVPLLLLDFTRLISPPLAVVALVHRVVRRRRGDAPDAVQTMLLGTYALLALAGPFAWSVLAGRLDDSAVTNRAGNMVTGAQLGWFDIFWGISPWAVAIPAVLSVWFARLAWLERRRLGPELTAWAAAYPVFILAVTLPTTGFFRYFMFAFPLGVGAIGSQDKPWSRRVRGLAAFCVVMVVVQYLWIRYSFVVDPQPGRPTLNP